MAETNNKEKTLAGIIYHDIKAYIKEKKEIRQRKKAENRKIKFREIFIEKCKKGYHFILVKYYARKENKTIKANRELEDVINKKLEHKEKYEEKEAAVNEMEQIRAEQKAAKEAEKAEKMATEEAATKEEEAPVVEESKKEEIAPEVEEQTKEETAPVVEEPKKEETAVAVIYPNPFEKKEEEVSMIGETKVEETTPVAEETKEEVTVVEFPAQEVETVSIDDVMAEPVQVESQKMNAELEAKLAENVQAILNEEQIVETENSNKNDFDILNETAKLGAAVTQLQEKVAVSLASKQRELDEVKEENKKLVSERNQAKEELEINERIHNDVVALKDQEINNRDQEIAALRQQLEQERFARVQAENQFRNLAVAIQNVQTMGTEQPQVESVQEESFNKEFRLK